MTRLFKKLLLASIALAGGIVNAAQPLEVILFPGAANWPLWVAQERGFFAANGLEVKLTFTPNSVHLMREILAGKYQLGHAGFAGHDLVDGLRDARRPGEGRAGALGSGGFRSQLVRPVLLLRERFG